jgi:hypothetical protein
MLESSTTGSNYFLGPGVNLAVSDASPERRLVRGFGASGFMGVPVLLLPVPQRCRNIGKRFGILLCEV